MLTPVVLEVPGVLQVLAVLVPTVPWVLTLAR
jgi:hypothetical protein